MMPHVISFGFIGNMSLLVSTSCFESRNNNGVRSIHFGEFGYSFQTEPFFFKIFFGEFGDSFQTDIFSM